MGKFIITIIKFVIDHAKDLRELIETFYHLVEINEHLKLAAYLHYLWMAFDWIQVFDLSRDIIMMLIESYLN
jgi:hypothetical protein